MEIPYQIHVHHDKKLKDYVFDFFMLFFAVSLGFFVENKREEITDRSREKAYIRSLLGDLREDTSKVNTMLFWNYGILSGLDTLSSKLYSYTPGDTAAARQLYTWYLWSARNHYPVRFTDRTLATLKSSGNLRIIRSQAIADSLMRYEEDIRIATAQEATYKDFWMRSLDLSTNIFDYKYIKFKYDPATNTNVPVNQPVYRLMNDDAGLLNQYANLLQLWNQVVYVYVGNIMTAKWRATNLIAFLKKEYDLD